MKPDVSVIVPFYNCEVYIGECISSICGQVHKNIELICVDDASSDRSPDIVRKYAACDPRIRLIHSPSNKGASHARNLGIAAACGHYASFVDSDDYLSPDFYQNLLQASEGNTVDIIKGSDIIHIWDDREEKFIMNKFIPDNKFNFSFQFTTAIYKLNLVQNVLFDEKLQVCEDLWFLMQALYNAKTIKVINSAQYYYRRHKDSLDAPEYDEGKTLSTLNYISHVLDFVKNPDLDRQTRHLLLKKLGYYINHLLDGRCKNTIYIDKFLRLRGCIYRYKILDKRSYEVISSKESPI